MRITANIAVGEWRRRARVLACGCAALISAVLVAGPASAGLPNAWTMAASMPTGRFLHVSATLPGGDVLVAGGQTTPSGAITNSAELYNTAINHWTSAGAMSTPRFLASAVALGSGKALVAGGMSSNSISNALASGEVYDPATNAWTSVANPMSSTRGAIPAAVLLRSGKVLIAGGADANGNPLTSADLYDPSSNSFTPASPMSDGRAFLSGILLPNGKVLVVGGQDVTGGPSVATAEVYDPGTNSWSPVQNSMSVPRLLPGMAVLPDGKVLVVGGVNSGSTLGPPSTTTATTDFYDPTTNSFSPGPDMAESRGIFGTTTLVDGRVLVAGGVSLNGSSSSSGSIIGDTEIYDPASNSWSEAGALPPVSGLTVNLLPNGDVLGAGGTGDFGTGAGQAEIFTPTSIPGAPVAVSAAPGNASAAVTFAPPVSDGGLQVQHYTIRASTGQTVTTPDGRTFATVPGLTNGRRVTFTVTATNAQGTGPPSAPSNPVTPSAPHARNKALTIHIFGLARNMTLTRFLAGVRFSVKTSKAASLRISLLASAKHATIARTPDLTLATKTLPRSARGRAVDLVPARSLMGHPRTARVELVIVATDAAGSRSTTSRWITIASVAHPRPPFGVVISTNPVTITPHGDVPIQLKCLLRARAGCSGTLTIRLAQPSPPPEDALIARCARGCRPLGVAHFHIHAGQMIPVQVHLSAYGRRLLAQRRTLRVTVTASVTSGGRTATTVSTITLRARTGSNTLYSAANALGPVVGLTLERSPRYLPGW